MAAIIGVNTDSRIWMKVAELKSNSQKWSTWSNYMANENFIQETNLPQ